MTITYFVFVFSRIFRNGELALYRLQYTSLAAFLFNNFRKLIISIDTSHMFIFKNI